MNTTKTIGAELKTGQTVQGLFNRFGRDMIVSITPYTHELASAFRGGAAIVQVASGRKFMVSLADSYDVVTA